MKSENEMKAVPHVKPTEMTFQFQSFTADYLL